MVHNASGRIFKMCRFIRVFLFFIGQSLSHEQSNAYIIHTCTWEQWTGAGGGVKIFWELFEFFWKIARMRTKNDKSRRFFTKKTSFFPFFSNFGSIFLRLYLFYLVIITNQWNKFWKFYDPPLTFIKGYTPPTTFGLCYEQCVSSI